MKLVITIIAATLLLLAIPFGFADNVTSSASVTNVAPTVGTVTATDPVTLSSGSTVTVWCNATITDDNGYSDISAVNATLWDPADTTETGADNNTNHYTNTSCDLTSGSGTTIDAKCSFTVQYYANPAEWTCKLYANDTANEDGTNQTATVTVNTLISLSVPGTLNFGELALGGTSADDVNHTVTNYGNTQIDINVSGTDMTCTIGTVPVGNTHYDITYNTAYSSMTALTTSSTQVTNFNLPKKTGTADSTKDSYWKLQMPSTGVGGSCTGTITFTAVAG